MKYVLASGISSGGREALKKRSIEIIDFPPNASVGEEIKNHADISFLFDGEETVFVARETQSVCPVLEGIGLKTVVMPHFLGGKYPLDCGLNIVILGKFLICNIDTADAFVLQYFKKKGKTVINARQGYTKCSVLPVAENAIITDDESVNNACKDFGIDVLLVSKGSVRLSGFDYGFIGGASGRISESEIAFNGDVGTHSDYEKINNFLNKYNMREVPLASGELRDVGSILPLYRETGI